MIMMILIFPADNSTFSFPGKLSQLHACPGGFSYHSLLRSVDLLKLTFVSRKMVDMQNMEQLSL